MKLLLRARDTRDMQDRHHLGESCDSISKISIGGFLKRTSCNSVDGTKLSYTKSVYMLSASVERDCMWL